MNLDYKKKMRNYWGPAILGLFFFLWAVLSIYEFVFDLSLRTVPWNVFTWLGVGAIISFFVWLNIRIRRIDQQNKPVWIRIVMRCVLPASITLILTLTMVVAMVSILSYRPEHVIEKNGYTMVARVHSFLDEYVYYYRYEGPLFYGQKMGYEYYGNGGGDPLSRNPIPEPKRWSFYDPEGNLIESGPTEETEPLEETQPQIEIKDLDIAVMENRENELVFDVSIDDFIDSYNSFWNQDHDWTYLKPSSEWQWYLYDTAIHSSYETFYVYFTEDDQIYPQSTVSVYVPSNGNYIQEITINFDEHSYSESGYEQYKQICFYTLKVFFPDLSDDSIMDLCMEAITLGNENVFTSDEWYSSDSVPCALFYKDGIGVYPYFAIGDWEHFCIIPVTQETIDSYEQKGVEIYEIG